MLDAVVIESPPYFHPEQAAAAVDAGKHVFVEKPHAVDVPGIHVVENACEEARKKGLAVVSGLCWRYDLAVRETMKRIQDGAIGDIVAAQSMFLRAPDRTEARQPDLSEIQSQFWNWYPSG